MLFKDGANKPPDGLKAKDLVGIPWRVAFALQADGWYLRQDIIWHKPNPMPESVTDRCTKAHEYVFLLSKSERYYYDQEALKEPVAEDTEARYERGRSDGHKYADGGPGNQTIAKGFDHMKKSGNKNKRWGANETTIRTDGSGVVETQRGIPWEGSVRNKRSVWTITTKPYSGAHFATFPPALIEPCILAGCPEGGTVLDPFGGAGTTGLVADRLQRNALLIELNPEYAEMARHRIIGDAPLFAEVTQ
jgi:DNA modification methylase